MKNLYFVLKTLKFPGFFFQINLDFLCQNMIYISVNSYTTLLFKSTTT